MGFIFLLAISEISGKKPHPPWGFCRDTPVKDVIGGKVTVVLTSGLEGMKTVVVYLQNTTSLVEILFSPLLYKIRKLISADDDQRTVRWTQKEKVIEEIRSSRPWTKATFALAYAS